MARAQGRRRLRRLGMVAVGVLVVGLGVAAALSPVFEVRHVRVDGLPEPLRSDVEREAAGMLLGRPLVLAKSGDVRARIASDPRIAAVRVSKEPPGTIRIVAARRVPVAAGLTHAGVALLAADATVVEVAAAAPAELPMVWADGIPSGAGQRAESARAALVVLLSLPPGVSSRVTEVRCDLDGTLELILEDGARVIFGRADDDPTRKGRVLEALMVEVLARGWSVHSYNVSSPQAPTVIPA